MITLFLVLLYLTQLNINDMATIDDFEINKGHSTNSILFALSRLFERAGYYGVRAVFLTYLLTSTVGMEETEAYALYGTFGALIYGSKFLGALIGDLAIGNRLSVIIGGSLQALGILVFTIGGSLGLYGGMTFLIIGSGFYDSNLLAVFGKEYLDRKKIADSGYGILYIAVNIGAFLGVLSVMYINETSMLFSLILAASLSIVATLIVLATQDVSNTHSVNSAIKPYQATSKNVVLVLLAIVMSALFWLFYDLAAPATTMVSYDLNEAAENVWGYTSFDMIGDLNSIVIICIGAVLAFVYYVVDSSSVIKVGIGFLLAATSFLLVSLILMEHPINSLNYFMMSIVILAIAEFFVVPPLMSIIATRSNPKYMAIMMSVFSISVYLLTSLFYSVSAWLEFNTYDNYELHGMISILALSFLGIVIVVIHFVMKANESGSDMNEVEI